MVWYDIPHLRAGSTERPVSKYLFMCQWYDKQVLCCCSGVVTTSSDREEFTQVWWDKWRRPWRHLKTINRILYSIHTLAGRMCNSLKASVELENFDLPRTLDPEWLLPRNFEYVDKAWAFPLGGPQTYCCSSPCVKTLGHLSTSVFPTLMALVLHFYIACLPPKMINSVLSSFIFRPFCIIQPLMSSRAQDNHEMEVSSRTKSPALNLVYRLWSSAVVICTANSRRLLHIRRQSSCMKRQSNCI